MAATTSVEIDSELLARLRERWPEKPDRQLIEDIVLIQLGFAALRSSSAPPWLDRVRRRRC